MLSALKPAESGGGIVVRVLNPSEVLSDATVRWTFPVGQVQMVRLDESDLPSEEDSADDGGEDRVSLRVAPHSLRSVRLAPGA